MADVQKFIREVQVEAKKVAWPDRRETIQSTLMVFVMVLAISAFLWGIDSLFGWLIQKVI